MFLLNLYYIKKKRGAIHFTSQYVSIKSDGNGNNGGWADGFTSQYVSIKSAHCHSYYLHIPPLHPNMFLLNHSFQHATTHS